MKIGKDELVAALGLRYDHYSATTVFEAARTRAQLDDKSEYEVSEVATFRSALARVGDRLDRVNARLDVLTNGAPVAVPAPPKADAAHVAAKAEAEPANDPKADTKADDHPSKPDRLEAKADEAPAKSRSKRAKPDAEPAATAAAPQTTDAAPTPTIVSLTGVALEDGEQLLVCGDFVAWDLSQAQPMARVGDAFLGTIAVVPGEPSAFKFLRKTLDGDVVWEAGENRTLVGGVRLDVTWGVR